MAAAWLLVGCPALLDDEFTVRDGVAVPPVTAGGTGGSVDVEPPASGASAGGSSAGSDGVASGGTAGSDPGGGAGGASAGDDGSGGTAASGQGGTEQTAIDPLLVLKTAIVNRYSFTGTGSALLDSVGGQNGTFERDGAGAVPTLAGSGALVLDGTVYGELPSGLISSHQSVTIEAWVSWTGGSEWQWQRIFDFGSNDAGAGLQGGNAHYLYLTPENASVITVASYKGTDGAGVESHNVTLAGGFPQGSVQHVAVIVDGTSRRLYFYLNGVSQGFKVLSAENPLSKIPDDNDWLGRSQSPDDPNFVGELLEFRIYDEPLDEATIAFSYEQGPDAAIDP